MVQAEGGGCLDGGVGVELEGGGGNGQKGVGDGKVGGKAGEGNAVDPACWCVDLGGELEGGKCGALGREGTLGAGSGVGGKVEDG